MNVVLVVCLKFNHSNDNSNSKILVRRCMSATFGWLLMAKNTLTNSPNYDIMSHNNKMVLKWIIF